MAEFVGTYKYEKDDGNIDNLFKALKVNFIIRKLTSLTKLLAPSPTLEVSAKDDGTIGMKLNAIFGSSQLEFKLGEEFEETRRDDSVVKTIITREDNKLIQKQESDPPIQIIREFIDDKLIITTMCKDIVCVREYKKI